MIKTCEICGKPYKGDSRSKFCSDECRSENKKIYQNKYYQENKKRILGQQRTYYQKNKEIILDNQKEYYQKNRRKILDTQKIYYQKRKRSWNCGTDCFECPHADCIY